MRKFACDPSDVLALFDGILAEWAEISDLFNQIWRKISTMKYNAREKKGFKMKSLESPFNGGEIFYGLRKILMPFSPICVLVPPLRYYFRVIYKTSNYFN